MSNKNTLPSRNYPARIAEINQGFTGYWATPTGNVSVGENFSKDQLPANAIYIASVQEHEELTKNLKTSKNDWDTVRRKHYGIDL
jgi:hypothetical protein